MMILPVNVAFVEAISEIIINTIINKHAKSQKLLNLKLSISYLSLLVYFLQFLIQKGAVHIFFWRLWDLFLRYVLLMSNSSVI